MGIRKTWRANPNFADSSNLKAFSFFTTCNLSSKATCVNVSQSTLDKLVYKSVTPAGNCTALSMESSLMVKCQVTKPLEVEMIPSTPSSVKLELENTFQELLSSILSLTESENLLISALVCKDSLSSTLSEEVLDPDSLHGRQRSHLRYLPQKP